MRQSDWILDVFYYWNEGGFFFQQAICVKNSKNSGQTHLKVIMIFSLLILISLALSFTINASLWEVGGSIRDDEGFSPVKKDFF